jgi:hypothetical protein
METIQFTGTVPQIDNLKFALAKEPLSLQTETKVFVLDSNLYQSDLSYSDMSDEDFISVAELEGRVHTLKGFQEAFNIADVNSTRDIIRFINVKV